MWEDVSSDQHAHPNSLIRVFTDLSVAKDREEDKKNVLAVRAYNMVYFLRLQVSDKTMRLWCLWCLIRIFSFRYKIYLP